MGVIRPATAADIPAIAAIYGHHCTHGWGTFEEGAPSVDEMAARVKAVQDRGLPYLVAEEDGKVAGFAYASPFRLRAAYRYTAEDTVYVAPGMAGRGIGKAVLGAVMAECETLGLRQLVAVIGGSDNAGSIGLHRSLGFAMIGTTPALGYKDGDWRDVVWMQKALGDGASTPPGEGGLDIPPVGI